MAGFFNIPNYKESKIVTGSHFTYDSSVNTAEWDVNPNTIRDWYEGNEDLYFLFSILGYRIKSTSYVVGTGRAAVIDHESMVISQESRLECDMRIQCVPLCNSSLSEIAIPLVLNTSYGLTHFIGDQTGFIFKREQPEGSTEILSLYVTLGEARREFVPDGTVPVGTGLTVELGSINDDLYTWALKKAVQTDVCLELLKKFVCRWLISNPPEERGIEPGWLEWLGFEGANDESAEENDESSSRGFEEEVRRYVKAHPEEEKILPTVHDTEPSGLLWLFNPEFWNPMEDSGGRLLYEIAEEAWKGLRQMNPGSSSETFTFSMASIRTYFQMQGRILKLPGVDKNRAEKFYKAIEERARSLGLEISEELNASIRQLSYYELLMFLINRGLISVPYLPSLHAVPVSAAGAPLTFRRLTSNGPYSGVDLHLFGSDAIEIRDQKQLFGTDRNAFTWQFIRGEANENNTLIIVAAPGVSIRNTTNHPPGVNVRIYRVQSVNLVPGWFDEINTYLLESSYTEGKMPQGAHMNAHLLPEELQGQFTKSEEVDAFLIQPRGDGVRITYPSADIFGQPSLYSFAPEWLKGWLGPATSKGYSLEVDIHVDPLSENQRYSYEIIKINDAKWEEERGITDSENPTSEDLRRFVKSMSLFQQYRLVVHYAGDVRVSVREPNPIVVVNHPDRIPEQISPPWVRFLAYRVKTGVFNGKAFVRDRQETEVGGVPQYIETSGVKDVEETIPGDPLAAIPDIGHPLAHNIYHDYEPVRYTDTERVLNTGYNIGDGNTSGTFREFVVDNIDKIGYHLGFDAEDYPENILLHAIMDRSDPGPIGYQLIGVAELVPIESYVSSVPLAITLTKLAIDVGVGFIPVVGDVVDTLELLHAVKTGKDKWGQPVSNFELQLMTAGALMPLSSVGGLRHLKELN